MLDRADRVIPHAEVVVTELDGDEAVLLHLDTKQYFSLNATGYFIWKQLGSERRLGDVAEALCTHYDVSPEQAETSVLTLVEQLYNEHLVSRADD